MHAAVANQPIPPLIKIGHIGDGIGVIAGHVVIELRDGDIRAHGSDACREDQARCRSERRSDSAGE